MALTACASQGTVYVTVTTTPGNPGGNQVTAPSLSSSTAQGPANGSSGEQGAGQPSTSRPGPSSKPAPAKIRVSANPAFGTKNVFIILLTIIVGLVFHGLMYAGQPAIMAEMFPTRMRYSGVSIAYQVTSIVAGSLAPVFATEWLKATGSWWPTPVYLAAASVITAIAVLTMRETKGASLHALDAADAARVQGKVSEAGASA